MKGKEWRCKEGDEGEGVAEEGRREEERTRKLAKGKEWRSKEGDEGEGLAMEGRRE